MNDTKLIVFNLNRRPVQVKVAPGKMLLDLLRDDLKLTGTKRGCGYGECGACTVVVNGSAVNSCIYPAYKVNGADVMTVEGLGTEDQPHPLQKAFIEEGAVQCGFCTPGMLMSSYALLQKEERPTESRIRESISGNVCRCTGYVKIINAIKQVADARR